MLSVLTNRRYRWLAGLYAGDALFGWLGTIALMVFVYGETDSTIVAAVLLLCKQVVPGALMPLTGSALDRRPLRSTLALAFGVQGAALALLGTMDYGLWVFPVAALAGLSGGVARSLLRAGVARALDGEQLAPGNALLNIFMGVAGLAGPAMAAVLVDISGTQAALVVGAAVFVGLGCGTTLMPALPLAIEGAPDSVVDDPAPIQDGSGADLPITGVLAVVGLIACVFSMDDPALLAFSEQSLGAGVGGYSAIFVAWGVGITLGSLLFTRLLHWPMLRVYAVATALAAFAYIGMSVSPTIGLACAFAVVGGVGNGMDWVAIVTVVQAATPKGREAWASTRLEAIGTVGPGLGILLGGVLADVASPRITILVPGLLALITIATVALWLAARGRSVPAAAAPAHELVPSIHRGPA